MIAHPALHQVARNASLPFEEPSLHGESNGFAVSRKVSPTQHQPEALVQEHRRMPPTSSRVMTARMLAMGVTTAFRCGDRREGSSIFKPLTHNPVQRVKITLPIETAPGALLAASESATSSHNRCLDGTSPTLPACLASGDHALTARRRHFRAEQPDIRQKGRFIADRLVGTAGSSVACPLCESRDDRPLSVADWHETQEGGHRLIGRELLSRRVIGDTAVDPTNATRGPPPMIPRRSACSCARRWMAASMPTAPTGSVSPAAVGGASAAAFTAASRYRLIAPAVPSPAH